MKSAPLLSVTYLIYIVFWETLVLGGIGYAVFAMEFSGWWFLLGLVLSSAAYRPEQWIHGRTRDRSGFTMEFADPREGKDG